MKLLDLTGEVYGILTVVGYSHTVRLASGTTKRHWKCVCECGGETTLAGERLRSGNTKSCGCRMGRYKHGHRRVVSGTTTKTYQTWNAMQNRCHVPTNTRYYDYGGKGVRVCDQWRGDNGFTTFLNDMGERPEGYTLDRIDGAKGYEPGNCRWATAQEQYQNKLTYRDDLGKFTHSKEIPNVLIIPETS